MAKKKIPDLNVEQVNNQVNLMFMTLLEYRSDEYLCIIDNITPTEIRAYVLDYADVENIPLFEFISVAIRWFYSSSDKHPLSVELAKLGLSETLSPIFRTFDATYVTRLIGQTFSYDNMTKSKVKRRRIIPMPEGIEIKLKKLS